MRGITNADVSRGYVQVIADGVKTYGELLNSLFALIDRTKVSKQVKLYNTATGSVAVLSQIAGTLYYEFSSTIYTSDYDTFGIEVYKVGANNSKAMTAYISTTNVISHVDNTNIAPASGYGIILYY